MKAGEEMDALVAEKVMGLARPFAKPPFTYVIRAGGAGVFASPDSDVRVTPLSDYSTDISAAMKVIEHLTSRGYKFLMGEGQIIPQLPDTKPQGFFTPLVAIGKENTCFEPITSGISGQYPHLICLAALKAVGAI